MRATLRELPVKIFSACPLSHGADGAEYHRHVIDVATWSEEAGCAGMLVYTDNRSLDAWTVAELVIAHTTSLSPLVAVQPIYMHPYTVAKTVASVGNLHGRRLYLNMVAGGFKKDLEALGDETPHDLRYQRLVEYTEIVQELLADEDPVFYDGTFYRIDGARLQPGLAADLQPGVVVSGSSDAGQSAAARLGATAVKYPRPPDEEEPSLMAGMDFGIRVGIIARDTAEEAWSVAHERFPEDRAGQLAHQLACKVSDSEWYRELSDAGEDAGERSPYWMVPFKNYKTFCPYLVGDHQRVAAELERYLEVGFRTIILDVPAAREDLDHIARALRRAVETLDVPA